MRKKLFVFMSFIMCISSYASGEIIVQLGFSSMGEMKTDLIIKDDVRKKDKLDILSSYNLKSEYNYKLSDKIKVGFGMAYEGDIVQYLSTEQGKEAFSGGRLMPLFFSSKYNVYNSDELELGINLVFRMGYPFLINRDGSFKDWKSDGKYYSFGIEKSIENYLMEISYDLYDFELNKRGEGKNYYRYSKLGINFGYRVDF